MRKYLLIIVFSLALFICPRVNAMTSSGNATVGRSAVMDSSYNYYYTAWTSLSSNSLNVVPIPTSQGNYYHMGSEYVYAITLNGESSFNVHIRIPVVASTIYNYQLMNSLNENDYRLGIDSNFGVYNINGFSNYNMAWECQTYSHLGIAHNYCYYDADLSFSLDNPLTGAYNLNFAILNTTGNRSAYYYSGYDSNGNAIEFPVSAQNSGYANLAPTVRISATSGGSSSSDTEEILEGISTSTEALQETIRESYENLVKSQEVCQTIDKTNISIDNKYLNLNGTIGSSNNNGITDYYSIIGSTINLVDKRSDSGSSVFCFYSNDKTLISCHDSTSLSLGSITIPSGSYFVRFTINKSQNKPIYSICQNGNQAIYDFVSDSNIDSGIGGTFLNGLEWYENSYFSSIITSPLQFLQSLSQSCTPITLTLFNQDVVLPCGTTVFWERDMANIATFRLFWNILFGGFIIYKLAHKLILAVNDCLDPTKDKVGDSLV